MIPLIVNNSNVVDCKKEVTRLSRKLSGYIDSAVLVDKLLDKQFSLDDIETIIDCINSTCKHCWNTNLDERDCYCTCDD